jgi:hypothetical protein
LLVASAPGPKPVVDGDELRTGVHHHRIERQHEAVRRNVRSLKCGDDLVAALVAHKIFRQRRDARAFGDHGHLDGADLHPVPAVGLLAGKRRGGLHRDCRNGRSGHGDHRAREKFPSIKFEFDHGVTPRFVAASLARQRDNRLEV